jgi:hypothetical protein
MVSRYEPEKPQETYAEYFIFCNDELKKREKTGNGLSEETIRMFHCRKWENP